MSFELFTNKYNKSPYPYASISKGGFLRFNPKSTELYLKNVRFVQLLFDKEKFLIGLLPIEANFNPLKVTTVRKLTTISNSKGANSYAVLSIKSLLDSEFKIKYKEKNYRKLNVYQDQKTRMIIVVGVNGD